MSRIGKKPIAIPDGVEAKTEDGKILIKGPKGELSFALPPGIGVDIRGPEERKIKVLLKDEKSPGAAKAWGTAAAIISNLIDGVTKGFEKRMEIEGVGFRAFVEADDLVLNVGYSHPVKMKIPKDIKVSVEKNIIVVSGIDKNSVGQFAANVRRVKEPEPYKGKGIRYQGEVIKRKLGKKAVGAGGK